MTDNMQKEILVMLTKNAIERLRKDIALIKTAMPSIDVNLLTSVHTRTIQALESLQTNMDASESIDVSVCERLEPEDYTFIVRAIDEEVKKCHTNIENLMIFNGGSLVNTHFEILHSQLLSMTIAKSDFYSLYNKVRLS